MPEGTSGQPTYPAWLCERARRAGLTPAALDAYVRQGLTEAGELSAADAARIRALLAPPRHDGRRAPEHR